MAWTYILECRDGSYYVGSTTDLAARLHQHQIGEGAAYTRPRRRRPVRLAWSGEFETAPEAFAFEKQVQGWSRAKREALMRGELAALPELASRPTARRPRRAETAVTSPGLEARRQRASHLDHQ